MATFSGDFLVWNEAVLQEFFRSPQQAVGRDLARRALAVESAAKLSLNDSFPPSSAPGSAPHKRTARLQTSISWRFGEDAIGLYADIGTGVEYGTYLEFGTERMEPRPFMAPSLKAALL